MIIIDSDDLRILSKRYDFRKSYRKTKSILPYIEEKINFFESHRGYLFDSFVYIGHTETKFVLVNRNDIDINKPLHIRNTYGVSFVVLLTLLDDIKEKELVQGINEEDLDIWIVKSKLSGNLPITSDKVKVLSPQGDSYLKECIKTYMIQDIIILTSAISLFSNIMSLVLKMMLR